jgi:hypothetical protein
LIFLAGHIAKLDGQPWVGQLGANLTTEQGKNAARAVAIDLMGELSATLPLSDYGRVARHPPKIDKHSWNYLFAPIICEQ